MKNEELKMENGECEAPTAPRTTRAPHRLSFVIRHSSFVIPVVLLLLGANRIEGKRIEGFTEPSQTIDVAAAENGIVQEVRVELGQAVKKGEVLGTLDDDVLKATLEIAQLKANSTAAIDAAKAELEIKEQKLNALTEIQRTSGGSREELSRAKADAELARAKLKSAEEALAADRLEVKRIEAQLLRRTIRSPIDGVITEIHREPGEFLSITEPKVFTVVRLDRLRAKFYIPAENAHRVSKGHRVKLTGQSDEKPLTGEVEFVSPVTHAESGLVRVDVMLDNRDGRLRSGQRLTLSGE